MTKVRIQLNTDVAAEVLPRTLSRAERRQIQIVEKAIRLCAEGGIEALGYERIAKECGVTRHLVIHYFPDRESLIERAMEYVWASLKLEILGSIDREKGAINKMKAYIAANMRWARTLPDQATFLVLFLHYASNKPAFRKFNSSLMRLGQDRILGILKEGVAEKVFACPSPLPLEAKAIQLRVLGHVMSFVTEDAPIESKTLEKHLIQSVLQRIQI